MEKITPKEYEKLTSRVVDNMKRRVQLIDGPYFGNVNRFEGISGINHQIDVSFTYRSQEEIRLQLCECKLHGREKVTLEEMLVFFSRINDIQLINTNIIVEGSFYTTIGYTRPGKQFADYYKIATCHVSEDFETYSFSSKDEVVVQLRTARLKASASSLAATID